MSSTWLYVTAGKGVNEKKEGEDVQIGPKKANNYRNKTYSESNCPGVRDCPSDALTMLPTTGALSRVRALDGIQVSASSLSLPYPERRPWKAMGWPHTLHTVSRVSVPWFHPLGTPSHLPAFQTLMFSPLQIKIRRRFKKRTYQWSVKVTGARREYKREP